MRLTIDIIDKLSNNLAIDSISLVRMSGSPFSWEKRGNPPEESTPLSEGGDDYIDYSYAKYLGGHPLYVNPGNTGVYIYNNRIEVVDPNLVISYSAMTRLENMDENKIDRDRVLLGLLFFTPLAIHAAIKKKKHTYTVIQYVEGVDEKERYRNLGYANIPNLMQYSNRVGEITIILDFDNDIYRIQPLIYNKMIESKGKQP
jgi:hypothetical protein